MSLNVCETTKYGYIYKWTNYVKGYKKRYFVLQDGFLSYYRNKNEMTTRCRGTINIANSVFKATDNLNFVISNRGSQSFYLRSLSESDQKKWLQALELAKNKSLAYQQKLFAIDGSCKDPYSQSENLFDELTKKNQGLRQYHETLEKKCEELCRSISELGIPAGGAAGGSIVPLASLSCPGEGLSTNITVSSANSTGSSVNPANSGAASVVGSIALGGSNCIAGGSWLDPKKLLGLKERANIVRISALALVKASSDYHSMAGHSVKRLQDMFIADREHITRLELMVEELAKQHSNLEQHIASNQTTALASAIEIDDESSDEDFHDAVEVFDTDAGSVFEVFLSTKTNRRNKGINRDKGNDQPSAVKLNAINECVDKKSAVNRSAVPANVFKTCDLTEGQFYGFRTDRPIVKSPPRIRRSQIPPKPNISINLWSILKNCIGKDLSRIPMPVNFSEPISMLQRLTEDFEYSHCLDEAAKPTTSSIEAMAYIAAFTVSSYASTFHRVNKPFNPLLYETYECDRTADLGWRLLAEQIGHHPPVAALHCESLNGWTSTQEFTMRTKFRGKYLQVDPLGSAHLLLQHNGHHYMWRKVQSTVHNIVVGKLWIDNSGEMEIVNFSTGERCQMQFRPYSYFSSEQAYRVTGTILQANGEAVYVLSGAWNACLDGVPVHLTGRGGRLASSTSPLEPGEAALTGGESTAAAAAAHHTHPQNGHKVLETTRPASRLWTAKPLPPDAERMYNFSRFAIELNEPEPGVAPTDSRNRLDQRLMEEGRWDEANQEKLRLENEQRQRRRLMSSDLGCENDFEVREPSGEVHNAIWFEYITDPDSQDRTVRLKNDYWHCKQTGNWSMCPSIF